MDENDFNILTPFNGLVCLTSTTNRVIASRNQRKGQFASFLHALFQAGRNKVNRGPYCRFGSTFLLSALQDGLLDLRRDFRVSRRSFVRLTSIVKDDKHHGWQAEIEVLLFLFWLACGCSYRVVTRSCGVPTATVCRIVHKQLNNIINNLRQFIHIPRPDEYHAIARGFANLAGTPAIGQALGAIDGTHVRVTPPSQDKAAYVNRKCQHTIQTQAVCNHEGVFLDIFTGYPGSVHDARVYRNSSVFLDGTFPPRGYYLLGDSAYPGSINMLTPFKEPEASRPLNRRYNYHHSRARCIVERAFGELKVRWRIIFTKVIELRSSSAPHVIAACCAMHNVCHTSGDILDVDDDGIQPGDDDDDDDEIPRYEADDGEGTNMRNTIAQRISAPADRPPHLNHHDYFQLRDRAAPSDNEN